MLKQALSWTLTPILILSAVVTVVGVAGVIVVSNWQHKLDS